MSYAGLSEKEEEMLKHLQQKKRSAKKHEADFWKEVDDREDEVLKHLHAFKKQQTFTPHSKPQNTDMIF